ncbi:MAG: outer membrane lipid asymmetry maintenance protein MlaD [Succinivibrionaceae bacterium]
MWVNKVNVFVGFFVFLGICCFVYLSLNIAGLSFDSSKSTYKVYANFDNIGSLKIRAPIKIGGVVIGRVTNISLDNEKYIPLVEMEIDSQYNKLSDSSKASILTSGLIGEQYIGITPGFYDEEMGSVYLKNKDKFTDTVSAIVLEDLIGKFLYTMQGSSKED